MGEIIRQNGEILFLYDARMCNPNGDPDDENRPRMDPEQERNLVSDVRLKRYIRDYLQDRGETIYVTKVIKAEGLGNATDRLKEVLEKEKPGKADLPVLLEKLVDVRLFGATMPIKGERRGEGEAVNLTGPVQFNWGYSLNRVQLVESNTISSQFASEAGARQGTFGKDFRLYYSLIAFHGIVSARRAEAMAGLEGNTARVATREGDLELLDEAMLKAIPLLATRSKIGQYPRLYARFVFADADTFMGDMRDDLRAEPDHGLRSVKDLTLEIGSLRERLGRVSSRIATVYVWQDAELVTTVSSQQVAFADFLAGIIGREKVKALGRS